MKKHWLSLLPLLFLILVEVAVAPRPILPLLVAVSAAGCAVVICLNSRFSFLIILIASLVVSFLLITRYYPVDPDFYRDDPATYNYLAKNILEPTTYRPPGYPLFIALIYRLIGSFDYKVVKIVQYLLFLTSAVCLGKSANLWLLFYTLNLPFLFVSNNLWSEAFTQALLVFFLIRYLNIPRTKGWLTGLLGAWLILTRPSYLVYLPILLLDTLLQLKNKAVFKQKCLILLIILVIGGGWSVRNSLATGKTTLIATNSGINFFLGNNPYVINGRAGHWPPREYVAKVLGTELGGLSIRDIHLSRGTTASEEYRNDKNFSRAAKDWILKNPGRFIKLALSKIQYLFTPQNYLFAAQNYLGEIRTDQFALLLFLHSLFFWVFLAFALLGLFNKKSLLIIFLSLPYLATIALSFSDTRFQLPLHLPLAILASFGVSTLSKWKQSQSKIITTAFILAFHLFLFKNTLITPWNTFVLESKKVSAAYNFIQQNPNALFMVASKRVVPEKNAIIKTFPPSANHDAFFVYQNNKLHSDMFGQLVGETEVYTTEIDIFSHTEAPFNRDRYYLEYRDKVGAMAIFSVKPKALLSSNNQTTLEKYLYSDWESQEKEVFSGEIDPNAKLVSLEVKINLNSELQIIGEETLVFRSYPLYQNEIISTLYFPASFFKEGITIKIKNNPAPNNISAMSMTTFNRDRWELQGVEVTNLQTLQP